MREKLAKIEAVFASRPQQATRRASGAAQRVQARLARARQRSSVRVQFSMPDQWSRRLFVALCRRYGLSPYRSPPAATTIDARPPRSSSAVLARNSQELSQALRAYLEEVTLEVVAEVTATRAEQWIASALYRTLHSRRWDQHVVFNAHSTGSGVEQIGEPVM